MLLEGFASMLGTMQVIECQWLAGGKMGVICGNKAYVSPAMLSLMRTEGPDLARILGAIEWKQLPAGFFDPPNLDGYMTQEPVRAKGWDEI